MSFSLTDLKASVQVHSSGWQANRLVALVPPFVRGMRYPLLFASRIVVSILRRHEAPRKFTQFTHCIKPYVLAWALKCPWPRFISDQGTRARSPSNRSSPHEYVRGEMEQSKGL